LPIFDISLSGGLSQYIIISIISLHFEQIFNNEIGKSYVKQMKNIFSDIGIKIGWFAIVNSQIIASGKTEREVLERVREVLPEDKLSSAYIFEYKPEKDKK
jgi:hypothetical protein